MIPQKQSPTNGVPVLAQVKAALKQILVEELDLNLTHEEIDEEAPLLDEGLSLDSITLVEFISLMEKRLHFEFADSDLRVASFANLGTLAEVVVDKLASDRAPHQGDDS